MVLRNKDLKTVAQLLSTSRNGNEFERKIQTVFKDKYNNLRIYGWWKQKSKLIRDYYIPVERSITTIPIGNNITSLKDSETYLVEILNEIKITNSILQETLNLFQKLDTKEKTETKYVREQKLELPENEITVIKM
jgi:hypothetical protein